MTAKRSNAVSETRLIPENKSVTSPLSILHRSSTQHPKMLRFSSLFPRWSPGFCHGPPWFTRRERPRGAHQSVPGGERGALPGVWGRPAPSGTTGHWLLFPAFYGSSLHLPSKWRVLWVRRAGWGAFHLIGGNKFGGEGIAIPHTGAL